MSPAVILSFIISKITMASGGHKEVEVDKDLQKMQKSQRAKKLTESKRTQEKCQKVKG